jgi:solute:Na+ symporter, SSS family
MGHSSGNPVGVEWVGLVMGLGFVLSFGYWCTDFLVVQRAMAAKSMEAARKTPLIAAVPKMLFPVLVVLPGMIALVAGTQVSVPPLHAGAQHFAEQAPNGSSEEGLIPIKRDPISGKPEVDSHGWPVLDYDLATPMMLIRFYPAGILGLGLTALLASFMSGMAGNVTAFNTVWTYDIYQSYIRRGASDEHYLWMGRFATILGISLSIAAAYLATFFNNIMDLLQLVFAFINAPLFATFALGMFWRRTTGHAAFSGLLAGTVGAAIHHGVTLPFGAVSGIKGGFLFVAATYPSELAQTFWTAIVAFFTCLLVTVTVSMVTQPKQKEELGGLVYALTERPHAREEAWYQKPTVLAALVLAITLALNIIFF